MSAFVRAVEQCRARGGRLYESPEAARAFDAFAEGGGNAALYAACQRALRASLRRLGRPHFPSRT